MRPMNRVGLVVADLVLRAPDVDRQVGGVAALGEAIASTSVEKRLLDAEYDATSATQLATLVAFPRPGPDGRCSSPPVSSSDGARTHREVAVAARRERLAFATARSHVGGARPCRGSSTPAAASERDGESAARAACVVVPRTSAVPLSCQRAHEHVVRRRAGVELHAVGGEEAVGRHGVVEQADAEREPSTGLGDGEVAAHLDVRADVEPASGDRGVVEPARGRQSRSPVAATPSTSVAASAAYARGRLNFFRRVM